MKKNKKRIIVLIVIVTVACLAAVFVFRTMHKGQTILAVPFAVATEEPLEERVSASGSFQADRYTVVSSKTIGIVKHVYVKPGDRVKTGDTIVVVDERDSREALDAAEIALEEKRRNLSIELVSLRAEIRKASLQVEQTQRAAKSAENLKAVDGISEEEYRKTNETFEQEKSALADARDKLRVAQGLPPDASPSMDESKDDEIIAASPSYRSALLNVEGARRALDGCIIKADGPGSVTEISVTVGTRLLDETTVARIEDPASVMAEVNVDEVDIGKIHEGMKADITADSMLGKTIPGTVSRIWPIVKSDGNGRVCKVRIALDLSNERFLSGASCMARITSVLRDKTLTIPAVALIPGSKNPAVWLAVEDKTDTPVASDNNDDANSATAENTKKTQKEKNEKEQAPAQTHYKVTRREITIGASTVSTLEVLSGLVEGDRVIVDQIPGIAEGITVVDANQGVMD